MKRFTLIVLFATLLTPARHLTHAQLLHMSITTDQTMNSLYVDGNLQTLDYPSNCTIPDNVQLPANVRVIACNISRTTNRNGTFGLWAVVSETCVQTDATWKCTDNPPSNWYEVYCDDSRWFDATEVYHAALPGNPSSRANWIWLGGADGGIANETVYCRGYVADQLFITAYESYNLYVDGTQQTNLTSANISTTADTVPLYANAKLLAICANSGQNKDPGILFSVGIDDYALSGTYCKVSATFFKDWQSEGFNDSHWPRATVTLRTDTIATISESAKWIWTSNSSDATIYCRCSLSKQFNITGESGITVYVNGDQIPPLPNANDWTKIDTFSIPFPTCLIGIEVVVNQGVHGGLLFSAGPPKRFLESDDYSTKCFPAPSGGNCPDNWPSLDYNSNSWLPATVVTKNSAGEGRQDMTFSGISSYAWWLTSSNPNATKFCCLVEF